MVLTLLMREQRHREVNLPMVISEEEAGLGFRARQWGSEVLRETSYVLAFQGVPPARLPQPSLAIHRP